MEKTSIIILAYKETEKFKRMFETLLRNTHQDETPYEIIVVDNNAEKGIKEYLETHNIPSVSELVGCITVGED